MSGQGNTVTAPALQHGDFAAQQPASTEASVTAVPSKPPASRDRVSQTAQSYGDQSHTKLSTNYRFIMDNPQAQANNDG